MEDKLGCLLWVLLGGVVILLWLGWNSKLRYAIQYGADFDRITISDAPHDCDWDRAPLGNKGCHYKKDVVVIKVGTDPKTGKPIVSYDEGKTWTFTTADSPVTPSVTIYYEKVEDQ